MKHGDGYYELCLAVIETSTVYYLHQDLCTELGGHSEEVDHDLNLTLTPGQDKVTLGWTPTHPSNTVRYDLIRSRNFHIGI